MTKKIPAPRMTFCIPAPTKQWLAKLAQDTGISEADHIRRGLFHYQVYLTGLELEKPELLKIEKPLEYQAEQEAKP